MPLTPRILLVDDHGRFRASLRDWLEHRLRDVEVLEAADGEEAVALAAERRPDLVLMDIGLPGMDGLEATRRILRRRPGTVVVVVSLHSTERHRAESAAAGAAAHVAKGSLPQGLEQALGDALRPRAEKDEATQERNVAPPQGHAAGSSR
jgi:DNA-binding NarL/FixJ family response regulator